jgi:hypothetical protein
VGVVKICLIFSPNDSSAPAGTAVACIPMAHATIGMIRHPQLAIVYKRPG